MAFIYENQDKTSIWQKLFSLQLYLPKFNVKYWTKGLSLKKRISRCFSTFKLLRFLKAIPSIGNQMSLHRDMPLFGNRCVLCTLLLRSIVEPLFQCTQYQHSTVQYYIHWVHLQFEPAPEIYIQSAPNNSNETIKCVCQSIRSMFTFYLSALGF